MSIQLAKQKIQKLRDLLNHHNYLYYVLDSPKISDFEFDSLMKSREFKKAVVDFVEFYFL